MNKVLKEHKLKSTGQEEVYSVSVTEGLINQVQHLGRSFSANNTDNYNVVKIGDIVYTKSPTGDFPLGIIKQSHIDNNVIVSPLYGVFKPITVELGYILENYFESPVNCYNYLHPIVQIGAKHTMNITNSIFLSKELYLPIDYEEQKSIANDLYLINKKINLMKEKINSIRSFKKYLLQNMFC
ncbi:restriction endonuclease subunit S [Methanosphaera sp. WGK6]|uniref:restriction endonuclease subunit S n=1 Tax=Methanosphaera sp. WGK6 TaxID=1561964 RepID=UPI001F52AC29|nr:restriction endonuclease subunit S [Methanosphaera sp. WGK6]